MAKKVFSKIDFNSDFFRVFLIVLGSIFTTIVLAFSVVAITRVQMKEIGSASGYLLGIFIVLGLSRLVTFLKERTKVSFVRFVTLLVVDVAIGILIFFGKDLPELYSICGGIFCITIIISRVFKIIQNHSVRSIVLNGLIILIFGFLATGLFVPLPVEEQYSPLLIICFIVAFSALIEVLSNAFSQLKLKTLFKIIIRTFALEIILGLLTMIVASSLIFVYFEDSITTFSEGLWYSFAVVTTIGFGDFAAKTAIGRIITVLLGIYGIIVVAVITSIIVNFYNETASGKHDAKELKQIDKEEKKRK